MYVRVNLDSCMCISERDGRVREKLPGRDDLLWVTLIILINPIMRQTLATPLTYLFSHTRRPWVPRRGRLRLFEFFEENTRDSETTTSSVRSP